jgi:DNA-binding transcriptional LysR family regulator
MVDRDWLILQLLHEYKNITRTAETLYISQPALTRRLRQIEQEFGITIVQRGHRGVQFTPEGEYLAKRASQMLVELREIKEHIQNMEQQVVGSLRLGVSNFITRYKLPHILKLFKDRYPEVEFKVVTGWSSEVFNLVYNQEVHVGFVRGDYSWSDNKYLLFEETICIASKNEINLANLPDQPRIDFQTDYHLKSLVDNWWAENYSRPPQVGMEVDKVETCKEMVVHGLGYGIVPSLLLEGVPDLFKVTLTDREGNPLLRRTWMLYYDESLELKLVKTFVDFVKSLDLQSNL